VKRGIKSPIFAAIAIASGLIVLLGYFIDLPLLATLRQVFIDWAVILAAVALLLGVLNLLRVHLGKIRTRQKGSPYSLVLIIALITTLLVAGLMGPSSELSVWVYTYVLAPIEVSLLALLAVLLIYAGANLFSRRRNLFTLVFVATVVLALAGMSGFPGLEILGLGELNAWISQVWAVGAARGILLGVALGTIATGLRVLVGADRPYGD
jgi:hypothetical protein